MDTPFPAAPKSNEVASKSWKKFISAINEFGIGSVSEQTAYEIANIKSFFDIYENDDVNVEIKGLIEKYKSVMTTGRSVNSSADILNRLDEVIPSYSEKFGTIKTSSNLLRVGSSLNVSLATAYANAHATSRNTPLYHSFSNGDCTNFVSQILEYSGVSQAQYASEYSGWWHKREKGFLGIGWKHTHSRSWTMANVFANYMGVTVSTTDILSWSQSLYQGDFIALDFTNDGSWDHMGYVTDRSGVIKSYSVPGQNYCISYSNFKVAQHTSDYNAWTSNAVNGWETYVNGRYGRIRGYYNKELLLTN